MKAMSRRTGSVFVAFFARTDAPGDPDNQKGRISMRNSASVRRLTISALMLAVGMLLPFLTAQVQLIGNMLSPMHFPVFICGLLCGPLWGLAVGAILPILRSFLFGMPPLMPTAAAMMFELAAYGLFSGLLRAKLPKTMPMLYAALGISMVLGRVVWGCASFFLYGFVARTFTWELFLTNGFVNAIPGIILQLIIIPPIVRALEKSHLAD